MDISSAGARSAGERAFARIAGRDADIRAWVHLDPAWTLAEADAIDCTLPDAPLRGLTLGVKDIVDVGGMPTRCGSPVSDERPKAQDAALVSELRALGALVVGKTLTTEFAFMTPGATRNPRDLSRSPGGSSSGSAAAVADAHVDAALGTQTAGSIIRPAAFCGVVGYKPTHGLFSLSGVKSISPSLDTVGWLARDAAIALRIYRALLPADQCSDSAPRFALVRGPNWNEADRNAQQAVENIAARLGAAEHAPDLSRLDTVQIAIMHFEMRRELAAEYATAPDRLSPAIRALFENRISLADYVLALDERDAVDHAALFGDANVLIMLPAAGEAVAFGTTGDPRFNRIQTLLGLPCVTVPAGVSGHGLPLGVQLVARRHDDLRLLQAAVTLEQRLR